MSSTSERKCCVSTVPVTVTEANEFVRRYHRHRGPVFGALFAIGAAAAGEIVGVAIVCRPITPALADGYTAEVVRLCTDGTHNACSVLYSAAWRAARAMGYRRLVTYTLKTENGASLRAAGWRIVAETRRGGNWGRRTRPRQVTGDREPKRRWEPNGAVTDISDSRDAQSVRQRCGVCGRVIALIGVRGKRRDAKFCSDRCRQRAHRQRKASVRHAA